MNLFVPSLSVGVPAAAYSVPPTQVFGEVTPREIIPGEVTPRERTIVKIGSLINADAISLWMQENPKGRQSLNLVNFVSKQIAQLDVKKRDNKELASLVDEIWCEFCKDSKYNSKGPDDFYKSNFTSNIENAVFNFCASQENLDELKKNLTTK